MLAPTSAGQPGQGHTIKSGTSMASPHIAGVAALCIAPSVTTGKCSGGSADVRADSRADAAARLATYGFKEGPASSDAQSAPSVRSPEEGMRPRIKKAK